MKRFAIAAALLLAGLALSLLTGCGPSYTSLATFAAASARTVTIADPLLLEWYAGEQRLCLDKPADIAPACVGEVRKKWAPVRDELAKLRAAWCAFEPSKCPQKGGL